ncbi:leiomodin-2-like [Cydia amplana]|uniref:leiomodin-2-like n=1 Tax=Cydia amplana TaxID=1869771 RepID=UPI002FE536C2
MLTEACRSRDARVSSKQNQIGRAIAALGKAMSGILTKSMKGSEVVKILNDAGKLLADSHFLETDTRRSLIMPLLDKSYVVLFKERQRDTFLFGENLGEFIKSSRGIKKTGELIAPTAPSTTTTNLNWTGPPRQQRVNRPPVQRGGGQRAPRAAPPPPPRPRRAPAPPPPAPRRAPPAPSRRPAPRSRSPYRRAT